MGIWVVIIVSGICTFFSFYTAFLAFRIGDDGAFLFAGFGLIFGFPFVISFIKVLSSLISSSLSVKQARAAGAAQALRG